MKNTYTKNGVSKKKQKKKRYRMKKGTKTLKIRVFQTRKSQWLKMFSSPVLTKVVIIGER